MNNEENKGFTVKDILIQLLIIILFVFMLVWLFPTKASFGGFGSQLNVLTNRVFQSNIDTMKDAAISYYTNERLPQAINDVERMTLGEMLDEHLLIEFLDGNGNKCDNTDSYVEVTKLENEYQMKINLSCTDNDAYIIVHLGCYDYCNNLGICMKEEKPEIVPNKVVSCEYEYEKVKNGSWGEFGAWTEWSTSAVSKTEYRNVETKVVNTLITNEQVQTGATTETIQATVNTTASCQEGYTLSSDKQSCVATSGTSYQAKCPEGYNLKNDGSGKCVKNSNSTTYVDPVCPDSSYVRNGMTCSKTSTSTVSADAKCPAGYTINNGTCYGKATTTYTKGTYRGEISSTTPLPSYDSKNYYDYISEKSSFDCSSSCKTVITYFYKKYDRVQTTTAAPTATPDCSYLGGGYSLSGNKCVKATSSTSTVSAKCTNGTLSNGKCVITGNTTLTADATCTTGYNLSGDTCYGSTTITIASTISTSNSCPEGYTISGLNCVRTVPVYTTKPVYKDVTYYRYQEREKLAGSRITKWSKSQNDKNLLSEGYTLTGNKKCS